MTAGLTFQAYRKDWFTPSDNEFLRTNTVKLPVFARFVHLLPKSLDMYLTALLSDRKHAGIKDKQDYLGLSPYTYTQLNHDLYSISYNYDMISPMLWMKDDPFMTRLGLNFMNKETVPELLAAAKPGDERDDLEKDCKHYFEGLERFYVDPSPPINKDEQDKWWEVISTVKHTIVVRMKTGGIALYDPSRIRIECAEWLEKNFGEVRYIISPSAGHTEFVTEVTEMFPSARVVASELAMLKMKNKGYKQKPSDCEYTNQEQLLAENELLATEGIEFIHVKGDAAAEALFLHHKPTNSLLECDLNYRLPQKNVNWRVITANFRHSSNNGSDLPSYRFACLDHTAGLIDSRLEDPADMAASLRGVLARDFDMVYGSHVQKMDGAMFRKLIDETWSWLDGKSLLR